MFPVGTGSRAPTILDVAERAGVSKSLVSLVFRGSTSVSEGRRQAVLDAASQLGYRANGLARRLVSGRTHTCGVIVTNLRNPFIPDQVAGINASAQSAGSVALFGTADTWPEVARVAETLLELRIEGLLIMANDPDPTELRVLSNQVPTVVIGTDPGQTGPNVDTVVGDDRLGAKLAINYLAELGHTNIVHLSAPAASAGRVRCAGYEDAMTELGLAGQISVFEGALTEYAGHQAACEALASNPDLTAMFVVNDLAAVGAFDAIEESSLQIPNHVSLVGYDNTFLAGTHHLSLTTVSQPGRQIGELAVQLLLERVEGKRQRPKHILLPPELVIRSSTGPPPSNKPRERKRPRQTPRHFNRGLRVSPRR